MPNSNSLASWVTLACNRRRTVLLWIPYIVYAPRIPPTHLNTATFENLQTLASFSEFVLWLIVRCWLLTSCWLLGAAGCSKLQCLWNYIFPRRMKPNKHQKLQNWSQNDPNMTPKWHQNHSKIRPNGIQNPPFEGLGALLMALAGFSTFSDFFWCHFGVHFEGILGSKSLKKQSEVC